MKRVVLTRDERVAHANMGVVVGVQVPLAKGGVAIPVPLCLPFPLGGSFLHRLKRETGPPLIHRHTNISSTKAPFPLQS